MVRISPQSKGSVRDFLALRYVMILGRMKIFQFHHVRGFVLETVFSPHSGTWGHEDRELTEGH
jgi:hypothetical protein